MLCWHLTQTIPPRYTRTYVAAVIPYVNNAIQISSIRHDTTQRHESSTRLFQRFNLAPCFRIQSSMPTETHDSDRARGNQLKNEPEISTTDQIENSTTKNEKRRTSKCRAASRVCNELGIVWAKLGKHPHWPAKIVGSEMEGDERYENSLMYKRITDNTCVLFYGTSNVAWIRRARNNVLPWKMGIQAGRLLHLKLRNRKSYQRALRDVRSIVRDHQ